MQSDVDLLLYRKLVPNPVIRNRLTTVLYAFVTHCKRESALTSNIDGYRLYMI